MLYFHLNSSQFIDPELDGITNNQGGIQSLFLNKVFNSLSDEKCLISIWSGDLPFDDWAEEFKVYDDSVLNGKRCILISFDDETSKMQIPDILSAMEEAHSLQIPGLNKSLNDMKLHYDYVGHIPNNRVNSAHIDYLAENNSQIITEQCIGANMTLQNKIDLLSNWLLEIGSEGNELTIIDPYIFPQKYDNDYDELFIGIINKARASSVRIITKAYNLNKVIYQKIVNKMTVPMNVYTLDELHDRFWLIESQNKGVAVGTSLNGFGKDKLSAILPLPHDDVLNIKKSIGSAKSFSATVK